MDAFSIVEPRPDGTALLLIGVRERRGPAVTLSFERVLTGSLVSPVIIRHVPAWEGIDCEIIKDRCVEEFVGDPYRGMGFLGAERGDLIHYLAGLL